MTAPVPTCGPTEMDPYAVIDMGLQPAEVTAIKLGWQRTMLAARPFASSLAELITASTVADQRACATTPKEGQVARTIIHHSTPDCHSICNGFAS